MGRLGKRHAGIGVLTVLAVALLAVAPTSANATTAPPSVIYGFPSSDSTVIASGGFLDDDEVGYFWSAARGDSVSETFSGPPSVTRAILRITVVTNVLSSGAYVDWSFEISGTRVGRFRVHEGFTGTFRLARRFPAIPGPDYDVTIRVTNEVASGEGSHTLAYAGSYGHKVRLEA